MLPSLLLTRWLYHIMLRRSHLSRRYSPQSSCIVDLTLVEHDVISRALIVRLPPFFISMIKKILENKSADLTRSQAKLLAVSIWQQAMYAQSFGNSCRLSFSGSNLSICAYKLSSTQLGLKTDLLPSGSKQQHLNSILHKSAGITCVGPSISDKELATIILIIA